jgi:arylsulfatase
MPQRPNILFFFSDQHRGDWMPYDDEVKKAQGVETLELHMPNIRGMMERGTAFSSAYSPAPVCAPARACLASGHRYRKCRVYQNNVNYDSALPSFYGALSRNGYYVTGTGKFDLNKADLYWGDGFHELLQRMGFSSAYDSEGKMDTIWAALRGEPGPYGRFLQEHGWLEAHKEDMLNRGARDIPTPLPPEYYADNWIGEKSKALIGEMPQNQPWFMQINFSGPHDPWDIPVCMKKSVKERRFPDAADCSFTELNQGVRQNYAAMIENIDRIIGECIEELKKRGMLENTLLVYAADHGEMMGDHSFYGKSKPEQGSVHIPIVIDASHLGGKAAQCYQTPVELQDLAATFLDYAGITPEFKMESVSLKPAVEGSKEKLREFAISELIRNDRTGPISSFGAVTDGKWKLIMQAGREDRLYCLERDPFECENVASAYPEQVARLRNGFTDRGETLSPEMQQYAKSFHAL